MGKRKPPEGHERHHRHPRSRKNSFSRDINNPVNISFVGIRDHRAYHRLFGNMTPPEMAEMLNDTWISPDYYLVAIPRFKKPPKKRRGRFFCTTCNALVLKYHKTCTS